MSEVPTQCPECGAKVEWSGWTHIATCGRHYGVRDGWDHGPTWRCLFRQLAQAREREKGLRDALQPFAKYYKAQKPWHNALAHIPVNQMLRACVPDGDTRRVVAQITIGDFRETVVVLAASEGTKE